MLLLRFCRHPTRPRGVLQPACRACLLLGAAEAGGAWLWAQKDEVPTVDVTGDLEWRAVKCAGERHPPNPIEIAPHHPTPLTPAGRRLRPNPRGTASSPALGLPAPVDPQSAALTLCRPRRPMLACDYLVQRLDTLTSTALIEGTVVASVRRKKGKRAVKDVPWTKSELGCAHPAVTSAIKPLQTLPLTRHRVSVGSGGARRWKRHASSPA
eukprot:COSAG04_NODE_935_length_9335_cov_46.007687_11_plen_211_part_00